MNVPVFWRCAVACAFCFLGSVAQATNLPNWVIYDLGTSRTEAICVASAQDAMVEYARTQGMRKVVVGEWVVYGWDMAREAHNAVITCNQQGTKAQALLVVHSDDVPRARVLAIGLIERFIKINDTKQDAWLADAMERNGF